MLLTRKFSSAPDTLLKGTTGAEPEKTNLSARALASKHEGTARKTPPLLTLRRLSAAHAQNYRLDRSGRFPQLLKEIHRCSSLLEANMKST